MPLWTISSLQLNRSRSIRMSVVMFLLRNWTEILARAVFNEHKIKVTDVKTFVGGSHKYIRYLSFRVLRLQKSGGVWMPSC